MPGGNWLWFTSMGALNCGTLSIEGKAENAGKVMFSFDLAYAGVFRIANVPKENMHPLVMIESPRLLFPFRALRKARPEADEYRQREQMSF